MSDRIKEIRERVEKATAGPWKPYSASKVVQVNGPEKPVIHWMGFEHADATHAQKVSAARFIAHARQDIPWLLTELESAQAELARLKADALKVTTEATLKHVVNVQR